ncbi:hypothetical protein BRD02_04370 [Halobacteriales archaeon QS_8_69_73]|nr:MAG: hypothetical protein BRD02_04370 [Halobacteriales archaeon QS_8_69_73]
MTDEPLGGSRSRPSDSAGWRSSHSFPPSPTSLLFGDLVDGTVAGLVVFLLLRYVLASSDAGGHGRLARRPRGRRTVPIRSRAARAGTAEWRMGRT